jgi:hypothetical protein
VTLKFKHAVWPAVGGLLVFIALAECLLWIMPPPHRRFESMIAGTAATVAALGTVFARVAAGKRIGAPTGANRRSVDR